MKERELFLAALEIKDPAARRAHLEAECADDAALLARVESLLASHEGQSQFLNTPVVEQIMEVSGAGSAATILFGNSSTHDNDPDATAVNSFGSGSITPHPNDADDEVPLGYLQPSTKPGSLGRLAHYEILEVIGRGAFGTVLRAFDEKLQRVVAIKVMAPELAITSPARKRFIREAQASAAIRHEHVVSVYAVEEKPIPYLVMEYIPGKTLQQRLDEQGPLDVPNVLRIGRQIAEGLAAAHAQDLIHRDIKPGNILLESGAREMVKVTDFGLARAADDASMTQSGMIAGTPMYMAPEQALGHKLDQRADLFSFGSVLYQMVSGRPPFRANGTLAVLKRVTEDTPRPISEVIPETPQWLGDIITKLHAKNPDERYQSAQEVAHVLADCEAQLKANAKLQDFSRIPSAKSASSAKWKLFAAGGVVGAMLLLGVIIITLMNRDGTKTRIEVPEPSKVELSTNRSGNRETSDGAATSGDRSRTTSAQKTGWPGWPADAPQPAIAPFDAVQARAHQEAWAKHLGVPVEYTNSIGMKFRLIPPGEFMMGMSREEATAIAEKYPNDVNVNFMALSSSPRHLVRLTKAFYLGTSEVTQEEYQIVVGANPAFFSKQGLGKEKVAGTSTSRFPVESVSFFDAARFCNSLSTHQQLNPVYDLSNDTFALNQENGYRLPTEAEWEFACRAGTSTAWFHGDNEGTLSTIAWYFGNSGDRPHPVGQLSGNPFGLYDMHGNVFEWCQDLYDPQEYVKRANETSENPHGAERGSSRLLRGGNWGDAPAACRCAYRHPMSPSARRMHDGIRLLISVDAVRQVLALSLSQVAPEARNGKRAEPVGGGTESAPLLNTTVGWSVKL